VVLACLAAAAYPFPLQAQPTPPPGTPIAVPAGPAGPPGRKLTLEEAKQLALQNNKALDLARLNVEEKQNDNHGPR
jgi:hypothetical protein